jgi:polynucleotide 5'-hydroxyl-kinase GRC3/NOL9
MASHQKPMSAIAAARLRAEATAKGVVTPEVTTEPVPGPADVLAPSPLPEPEEYEDSELDEEPFVVKQNLKLCTWRNESQNTISNTDSELTVKLSKHTTIALIGVFRFRVLKGAVHINGANIGALSRNGQKDQIYSAYVPSTHPISKIRGLDNVNHVQFISCEEPKPLATMSSLFSDIWNVGADARISRSFQVVSHSPLVAHAIKTVCGILLLLRTSKVVLALMHISHGKVPTNAFDRSQSPLQMRSLGL